VSSAVPVQLKVASGGPAGAHFKNSTHRMLS